MQGIQKVKCESCGTMFMSETTQTKCPTCIENQQGSSGSGHMGCGCGHSHWFSFFVEK